VVTARRPAGLDSIKRRYFNGVALLREIPDPTGRAPCCGPRTIPDVLTPESWQRPYLPLPWKLVWAIGSAAAVAHQPARASRLRTVLSCQAPPRAVRTPRSFNALATERNVVAPAACIWRTIGSTLAAKASAASRLAARPLACASGRLVRFPRTSRDRRQSFATWAHIALMAAPQFQVTARPRSTPAGRIGSLASWRPRQNRHKVEIPASYFVQPT
jgi:hypothetical protein